MGLIEQYGIYIVVLFMISEALALLPQLKSNSVLLLIIDVLKALKSLVPSKK